MDHQLTPEEVCPPLQSSNRFNKWYLLGCLRTHRCAALSETPSKKTHDALTSTPVASPLVNWVALFHNWTGSLLICNPIRGEGRSQEPAFSAFTNRIHHQSRTEAHLEREHGLTKHLLHKINASRLLPVQVPLKGASDLNYQECCRKQRASLCSLSQQHHGN